LKGQGHNGCRLAAALLAAALCLLQAAAALSDEIRPGDVATLDGVLAYSQGEDDRRRPVVYPAIRLRRPLVVVDAGERLPGVELVKLRLNRQQEADFRRMKGRQARVSGRLHFFRFGPNTLPNPIHLEVFAIHER
jgi:hypothetical protein